MTKENSAWRFIRFETVISKNASGSDFAANCMNN